MDKFKYPIIIKVVYSFFLLSLIGSATIAQKKETFSGKFQYLSNKEGYAKFDFYKDEKDNRIFDGKFEFVYISGDTLGGANLLKEEIKGAYRKSEKEGEWLYYLANHQVLLKDVEERELVYELSSELTKIIGNYRLGLPYGKWEYNAEYVTENEIKPKAKTNQLVFKSGYLTGEFQYTKASNGSEYMVSGFLDDTGHMDSIWVFNYQEDGKKIQEKRHYTSGILKSIQKTDEESGLQISVHNYEESQSKLKAIKNGDSLNFKLSEVDFGTFYYAGYHPSDEKYIAQLKGNNLIDEALKSILKYDDALYFEGAAFLIYPIKTRRFEFHESKEDKELYEQIKKTYKKLVKIVDEQQGNNAIVLNKNKTDTLAFAYAYFQFLGKKLNTFSHLNSILEKDEFKYLDQDIYKKGGVKILSLADTLSYKYDEKDLTKVLSQKEPIEKSTDFIRKIANYLEFELQRVNLFNTALINHIKALEIDSNISDLEEKVQNHRSITVDLYRNSHFLSQAHEDVARAIERRFLNDRFESMMKIYDRANNYVEKVKAADDMLEMLETLDRRHEDFIIIFERRDEIDDLYYENIFNAFTFSSYDQRAKERLYKGGNEKLFSYYLNELKNESNHRDLTKHIQKISQLQDKMIELRDEETQRLERKLRRNDTPNQIATLLGLEQ